MSSSKNPLVVAKQNLCSVLSPSDWKSYLGLLKQWFKRIITKETFDAEARKLCASDRRCLQRHNDFLLAVFSTCQSLSNASGMTTAAVASSPAAAVALPSAAVVASLVKPAASAQPTDAAVAVSPVVVADGALKAVKTGVSSASVDANKIPCSKVASAAATPISSLPGSTVGAVASANPVPFVASAIPPNASPSRSLSSTASPTHANLPKSSKERKDQERKIKKDQERSRKIKKPKTNKISFHNNFTPTNPLAYCQQIVPKPPEEEQGLGFAFRDRTLPDSSLIHGRMLVAAWDVGLEVVDEAAVRFLHVAVEMHVRALLLKMVKDRNSFKLRDGRFPSNFSAGQFNVYSRRADDEAQEEDPNSSFASDEEAAAAYHLGSAVGSKRRSRPPLTLAHLRDTLQRNKNVVASHTVYAINMERILNTMEHETVEEAELEEQQRREKERNAANDERQLLTRPW